MSPRAREVARLRRERPRSRLVRASLFALAAIAAFAWLSGRLEVSAFFGARRFENLGRFLAEELRPYPLRGRELDLAVFLEWAADLWSEKGRHAALATLAISVLAICLAGLAAVLAAPLAARTLAEASPYLDAGREPGRARALAWRAARSLVRALFVLARALPEYLLAYLLLAILGPTAWPAVLALALHNAGILGRLDAEVIENLPPRPLEAVRAAGASRSQLVVSAIYPLSLGRFLLYFFYRFETCVREATVLGLLGVVSLGYWIQEARAAHYYDEMLFLVVLGAGIVLAADVLSVLARRLLRNA